MTRVVHSKPDLRAWENMLELVRQEAHAAGYAMLAYLIGMAILELSAVEGEINKGTREAAEAYDRLDAIAAFWRRSPKAPE
jgi:hypothetical protein